LNVLYLHFPVEKTLSKMKSDSATFRICSSEKIRRWQSGGAVICEQGEAEKNLVGRELGMEQTSRRNGRHKYPPDEGEGVDWCDGSIRGAGSEVWTWRAIWQIATGGVEGS
jgi:hypothetical protein